MGRGFIDGAVSVLLAGYLTRLGLSPVAVGAIVTGTLFGSGALTLGIGLVAHRFATRRLLLLSAGLMVATGLGFVAFDRFWPLFVVGVVGTLNPSSGDVSVFLPVEQAVLASSAFASPAQTALFARYNVVGTFSGAIGALAAAYRTCLRAGSTSASWPPSGACLSSTQPSASSVFSAVDVANTRCCSGATTTPWTLGRPGIFWRTRWPSRSKTTSELSPRCAMQRRRLTGSTAW